MAPLISIISASGGVGKSTIALISAHLSAMHGIRTALVEGDLQFGDMGYWLGMDVNLPSLSQGLKCEPITISHNLDLFKAPVLPELAEKVSDEVAQLIQEKRQEYQLVIADTGQFWTGLTADLIVASDLILLVMDQRDASIYGAIKALELCQRIGVPAARVASIYNRAQNRSKSECARICDALGCSEVHCLGDGKAGVESLIGSGRIEELVESECAPVPDMQAALCRLLPLVGLAYEPESRKKTRRLFS